MQSKFIKKVTTAAIAATTLLSLLQAPAVLAETLASGTEGKDVKVSIRKTLDIAEGITTPTATFSFHFTPKQVEASGITGVKTSPIDEVTPIQAKTIQYSENDKLESGKKAIKRESDNIFKGITYPHAGEYVYDVSEEKTGWTPIAKNGKNIDAMKYDEHTYEMHVFVKNKPDGSGTYISTVYFKENTTGSAESGKKDAETSTNTDKSNFTFDLFENVYTKQAGKITSTDPNPNHPNDNNVNPDEKSLSIKKVVTGDLGSKTQDFTFSLTITLPETEQNKSVIGKVGDQSYTFESGVAQNFTLHHDQLLTFDNLPAGSKYSLIETGVNGYTGSAEYIVNGEKKSATGQQSTNFQVNDVLIGEKKNDNTVTNTYQDVTPTGLLIDNLPFILMIGLGLTGFVALSRKRRQG